MLHSLDDNIAHLFVKQLSGFVPDANFKTDRSDTALDKAAFNLMHHQPGKPSPSELGRDPDCSDMAGSVRFDHSYRKGAHLTVGRANLPGYCLGIVQQVAKRFALVGLAVDKTAQIELPAFV